MWYPDLRPVSFIEDDWYDDFPLVWADGWFSTAARSAVTCPHYSDACRDLLEVRQPARDGCRFLRGDHLRAGRPRPVVLSGESAGFTDARRRTRLNRQATP